MLLTSGGCCPGSVAQVDRVSLPGCGHTRTLWRVATKLARARARPNDPRQRQRVDGVDPLGGNGIQRPVQGFLPQRRRAADAFACTRIRRIRIAQHGVEPTVHRTIAVPHGSGNRPVTGVAVFRDRAGPSVGANLDPPNAAHFHTTFTRSGTSPRRPRPTGSMVSSASTPRIARRRSGESWPSMAATSSVPSGSSSKTRTFSVS